MASPGKLDSHGKLASPSVPAELTLLPPRNKHRCLFKICNKFLKTEAYFAVISNRGLFSQQVRGHRFLKRHPRSNVWGGGVWDLSFPPLYSQRIPIFSYKCLSFDYSQRVSCILASFPAGNWPRCVWIMIYKNSSRPCSSIIHTHYTPSKSAPPSWNVSI